MQTKFYHLENYFDMDSFLANCFLICSTINFCILMLGKTEKNYLCIS